MSRFRNKYRELTPEESLRVEAIKEAADIMALLLDQMGPGDKPDELGEYKYINADPRMKALAMTKLEECVMWAVKAITG